MAADNKRNVNLKGAIDVQKSAIDVQKSAIEVQKSAIDVQKSAIDTKKIKKPKRKKSALNILLHTLSVISTVALIFYIGFQIYASTIITTGAAGVTAKEYQTPPQYAGDELNVLLLGIDYTSEDGQGRDPNGNTDMIMYVRFNFADNTIRMLQIPRDTYVGLPEETAGTAKINALYAHGSDENNKVNNLAQVLSDQYGLPVDNYATIDMDSLREIIDLFGGITVYVAEDMQDADGSYIPAGWQHLDGASSEFFVRNRSQYTTADIQRLDNQRYFYSAVFRLIRTSPWQELLKLVPVVQQYVNTDLSTVDCGALAIRLLSVPSENILLAKLPVADATELYNGESMLVAHPGESADLLNEYFRHEENLLPVEELNIAQLPANATLYETNVQWMSDIDADGGGTVGQAADDAQTGQDIIDQAQQEEQQEAQSEQTE